MRSGFVAHQTSDYQVATPIYEGPLDLLLQLIERAELDITRLALAQVTDQYLAYIQSLVVQEPDEVSSFLVIATRLLQIKSEALLPRPPARGADEEDPGEALARQLITYKRFKEIAEILKDRETRGFRTFLRLAPPPRIEVKIDLSELTVEDIFQAAFDAFANADDRQELGTVVAPPKITIREKISIIIRSLRQEKTISFRRLLGLKRSRLDIVVTFLALLELVKRHFVEAHQDELFGDITLETSNGWQEEVDFDLEFGE